jgi:hypothetical protein
MDGWMDGWMGGWVDDDGGCKKKKEVDVTRMKAAQYLYEPHIPAAISR